MNVPKARGRDTARAFVACMEGRFRMMKIPDPGRGLVRCLGLAAAAILVLSAAASQRAEALSLINPGAAPTAKHVSDGLTTEGSAAMAVAVMAVTAAVAAAVSRRRRRGLSCGGSQWRRRFHGGGFRSGGAVFHGGGFRTGHVFRGGGFRHGGFAFRHHHHFHRHFYYAPSYYYYPHRRCRVVWTYYGPRKICRYRPWTTTTGGTTGIYRLLVMFEEWLK